MSLTNIWARYLQKYTPRQHWWNRYQYMWLSKYKWTVSSTVAVGVFDTEQPWSGATLSRNTSLWGNHCCPWRTAGYTSSVCLSVCVCGCTDPAPPRLPGEQAQVCGHAGGVWRGHQHGGLEWRDGAQSGHPQPQRRLSEGHTHTHRSASHQGAPL